MNDLATAPTETVSTIIDTEPGPSAAGGGTPSLTEPADFKPEAPVSVRQDLETVFKEDDAKADAKADEKPAKEEKPADAKVDDGKKAEAKPDETKEPAKDEAKAETAKAEEAGEKASADETDKGDDKKFSEPPKNFLPDAREHWRNTPRTVRRDIEVMTREHEAEVAQFREVSQRYEAIRQFDDLARSNGRELKESLTRVVEFENLLATNPIAGLNRILMEAGPRKADGQPVSLFEVAQHVVQMGQQGYQKAVVPPPQQQGPNEVEALQKKIEALEAEMTARPIIERFASNNDRYHELQNEIAHFLQSGMIPASLEPEERLAAAYDMAVRIRPASSASKASASATDDAPDRRADNDFSGSKSIKSSPGAVTEEVEDRAGAGESIRDSIYKAGKTLARA